MPQLDLGTLRDLLIIGIAVLLAAMIGGGLDAAGFFKIPHIRDWRVQLLVGAFGACLMGGSIVGFTEAQASLDTAQSSAQWETKFENLRRGSAGLPPPKWSPQFISDELEEITVGAGDDLLRNCEVAAFVTEHAAPLPYLVSVRIKNSTKATSQTLQCFRQLVEQARDDASRRATTSEIRTVSNSVDARHALFASNDPLPLVDELRSRRRVPLRLAQASEVAPDGPTTNILEAAASVDERGWIFLGTNVNGQLGPDRTIVDPAATVGALVDTRLSVNLRRLSPDDDDYRRHRVQAIAPPGTRLFIERLVPSDGDYVWARVRIVALPT